MGNTISVTVSNYGSNPYICVYGYDNISNLGTSNYIFTSYNQQGYTWSDNGFTAGTYYIQCDYKDDDTNWISLSTYGGNSYVTITIGGGGGNEDTWTYTPLSSTIYVPQS